MNGTWRDCIDVAELPELYRTIAEAIGRELMIELAVKCQKVHFYFRQLPEDAEKLSEDYLIAANAIGLDNVRKLAAALPSEMFYLVDEDLVFMSAKKRWIVENFTGNNHRRLSIETRLSQPFVYKILRKPGWQQLDLFMEDMKAPLVN